MKRAKDELKSHSTANIYYNEAEFEEMIRKASKPIKAKPKKKPKRGRK